MEIFRSSWVFVLACAAGAITWLVFGFELSAYSLSETGPTYYSFSVYGEYREASDELLGLGYALLTGLLVVAAALAAAGSIALPVLVPAALPRLEYGKDPVFHTPSAYEDPTSGRPVVCLAYGVEGVETDPTRADEPGLCLQLPDRSSAPRLVTGRPLALDPDTPYRLANALNESGIRPRDSLDGVALDGVEIARATWGRPQGTSLPAPPTGDRETKRQLGRLAKRLNKCSAGRGYAACTDIDALARAGLVVGQGSGRLSIAVGGRNSYAITGQSTSGTAFTLSKRRGKAAARFCTPPNAHGCSPDGRW